MEYKGLYMGYKRNAKESKDLPGAAGYRGQGPGGIAGAGGGGCIRILKGHRRGCARSCKSF